MYVNPEHLDPTLTTSYTDNKVLPKEEPNEAVDGYVDQLNGFRRTLKSARLSRRSLERILLSILEFPIDTTTKMQGEKEEALRSIGCRVLDNKYTLILQTVLEANKGDMLKGEMINE